MGHWTEWVVLGEEGVKVGCPGGTGSQLYGAQLTTRGHCLLRRVQDPGIQWQPGPKCYRLAQEGGLPGREAAAGLFCRWLCT